MKSKLINIICETMPTAAECSGLASVVDHSKWVREMSERFSIESRTEDLGLTALSGWLANNGVCVPVEMVKILRKAWIKEALIHNTRRAER